MTSGDLKKWGNYPGVIAENEGGGYPPSRVIRGIRVRIELPCPPPVDRVIIVKAYKKHNVHENV